MNLPDDVITCFFLIAYVLSLTYSIGLRIDGAFFGGYPDPNEPSEITVKVSALSYRSVYFTENSGYRSLKNRSCVTVFGFCSATLTVGEPLGDVSGSANHDFRISVTGIFCEIGASLSYS